MRNQRSSAIFGLACCFIGLISYEVFTPTQVVAEETPLSRYLIGYREFRTNLPGGRFANVATTRAYVVRADGTGRREIAPELVRDENAFTTFVYPVGWSPDGRTAVIGNGHNSPENAAWEEANQNFRLSEGWLYDMNLVDFATGQATNISAVERLSNYNNGLTYWPGNANKLLGSSVINGLEHPISMDVDGRNKVDLTSGSTNYTYGASISPDGTRIAYHSNYQVYVANADGSNPQHIVTPNGFNFGPSWSPDGQWLMFLSGEHTDSDPYLVRSDGTGLRKLVERNGHTGMTIMDVPDFHGGSSDVPIWSRLDSRIYYTAKIGDSVELMRVTIDGTVEQLTHSTTPGTMNYMPSISPDGKLILFGSTSSGRRQLYVMPVAGGDAHAITNVPPGSGAMFGSWNPAIAPVPESTSWIPMATGGLGVVLLSLRRRRASYVIPTP